jgi:hypothetical protein
VKKIPTAEEVAEAILQHPWAGGWTGSGAYAVAEHLVEKAKNTGQDVDFDPESIVREFSEWPSVEEWADANFRDKYRKMCKAAEGSPEDLQETLLNHVECEGTVIEVYTGKRWPSSFVISNDIVL